MSKHNRNYNPYYRVKVRLSLRFGDYHIERVNYKFATKEEADKKKAEVETILNAAIKRENEIFSLGPNTYRSEDIYGFQIKTKDPDPVPEIDDEDDDD